MIFTWNKYNYTEIMFPYQHNFYILYYYLFIIKSLISVRRNSLKTIEKKIIAEMHILFAKAKERKYLADEKTLNEMIKKIMI